MTDIEDVITFLEEEGIATGEEIDLVTKINGYNLETYLPDYVLNHLKRIYESLILQ